MNMEFFLFKTTNFIETETRINYKHFIQIFQKYRNLLKKHFIETETRNSYKYRNLLKKHFIETETRNSDKYRNLPKKHFIEIG